MIPKPKSFLYFMSLKTGAELICIFTLFNKASGIYGVLSLLTGAPISGWQLSMYIYSILAAVAFATSLRYIQSSSPLESLLFAWFFMVDTVINFAYTALFATSWFLVLSQSNGAGSAGSAIAEGAGFTSPSVTVSSVVVVPTSAVVTEHLSEQVPVLGDSVLHPEQYPSIAALVLVLLVKAYFTLIVCSFARDVVSQSTVNYTDWRNRVYTVLSSGSYWRSKQDLRLSKTRSQARDAS